VKKSSQSEDSVVDFSKNPASTSQIHFAVDIDEALEKMHIESTKIDSLSAFKLWTRQSLRTLLPHEVLCCGFGRLNSGSPSVDGVVSIDYPTEILKSIQNNAGGIDSPLLKRWLIRRTPLIFSGKNPWPEMPANWLEQFRKFDLRNAAVHAVSDERMSIGTYYSFHRIPVAALPLYERLLDKIAPIMHLALSPLILATAEADPVSRALKTLSKRELEIVKWVKVGKTNKEIADILNVAEMTVKHHMFNIFEKFGDIGSRTQLATRLTLHEAEKSMSNARLKII
jgi:DNA-binding CsgD family transcriptional regulator